MESIQPSLRDFGNAEFIPGVETPGYYRDVPLGQGYGVLFRRNIKNSRHLNAGLVVMRIDTSHRDG